MTAYVWNRCMRCNFKRLIHVETMTCDACLRESKP